MGLFDLLSPRKSSRTQWSGYYEQDGQQYLFRAEFVHTKTRFHGKIIDSNPTYSRLVLEDYMELSTLSQNEKTEYRRKIAQSLGCAETDLMEVSRTQTENSFVEGDIVNDSISFVKTYESGVVITFFTHTHQISHQTSPYSIRYQGTISEDGNYISGKWALHEKAANIVLQGPFVMNRV